MTSRSDPVEYSPITALGVCRDEFDRLSDEEQVFLREQAAVLEVLFSEYGITKTGEYLKSQRLDMEEGLALWSLLPSNIRSQLKKAGYA